MIENACAHAARARRASIGRTDQRFRREAVAAGDVVNLRGSLGPGSTEAMAGVNVYPPVPCDWSRTAVGR